VLFLIRGMTDDIDAISAFTRATAGAYASDANCRGVVSQSDLLGDEDDPIGAARRKATRLAGASDVTGRMLRIVPTVGLLAAASAPTSPQGCCPRATSTRSERR
jgi:hypothetical protein